MLLYTKYCKSVHCNIGNTQRKLKPHFGNT